MTNLYRVDEDDKLYVLTCRSGYTCLGFDVCQERMDRLAREMSRTAPEIAPGTPEHYQAYQDLLDAARATGKRFACELSPQLIGLEGWRVEVVTDYGETRRFIVGRSTGWMPIHLEISRRSALGGSAAERYYKSVRGLYKAR